MVQPTQLTRSLSVSESVKESRQKLQSQFNTMAIDLHGSDMRDESLQSTHLWFVCGFKATLHVLIFAVIGHINTINIPQIFQEFMDLLVWLSVRTYIVSRGPLIFLDKSRRSKGLYLQGSEGPWLNLMMVAHGWNCACHLIIFRGLFKHMIYLSWGTRKNLIGLNRHQLACPSHGPKLWAISGMAHKGWDKFFKEKSALIIG